MQAKELQKCLESGFGDDGCFGKNNFFRQNIENIRREVCNAVGNDKNICGSLTYLVDNALMPGKGHELVKYFNHGLSDIRNGPGKNNEFVKAGKAAEYFLQDAGGNAEGAINNIASETAKAQENLRNVAKKAEKDFKREALQALEKANEAAQGLYNQAAAIPNSITRQSQQLINNVQNEAKTLEQNTRRETQNGLDKVNNALGIPRGIKVSCCKL